MSESSDNIEDFINSLSFDDKLSYIKRLEIKETMFKFATEYHRNTSGNKLRFDTFLHMIELYDDGPLFKDIVIMGGTQIGKTDWLVVYILAAAYHGLNVFYILPHNKMRDKYVQEKILKPIKSCKEYKEIKREAVADSVEQMQFGKGMIRFVSANVESEMTSYSADIIVIDETDQISTKSIGNLELAKGRVDGSKYKFTRYVSNPGEIGYISSLYDQSDKRVRKCPCTDCKEFHELDWFETIVEKVYDDDGELENVVLRDKEWFPGSRKDINPICPSCGGKIDRFSPESEWAATAVSERQVVGYHMPSMISHSVKLSDLWHEYKEARDNPSKMKAFYSRRLALSFEEQGHKISANMLQKCVEKGYRFQLDNGCAYWKYELNSMNKNRSDRSQIKAIMGVDVSPTHLDISIAIPENFSQKLVYIGKIDPEGILQLADLVERYCVKTACIDIGPERLFSEEFQSAVNIPVWMVKYKGSGGDRSYRLNWDDMIYTADRTQILEWSYSRYKSRKIILPENFNEILDGEWEEEMLALTRTFEEDSKGVLKVSWSGSKKDHSRHSDAYRNIAFDLIQNTELTLENIFIG